MKKTQKEQSGQSLVELAISLMIMLLLLLGAIEFSLALFQYVTIRDAAQEGAIYGSINPTDVEGMQFRAQAAASDVVQIDPVNDVTVTINGDDCEGSTVIDGSSTPNSLTVVINFDHPITFPLVGPMIGTNTINLTASVTNTILQPTCP